MSCVVGSCLSFENLWTSNHLSHIGPNRIRTCSAYCILAFTCILVSERAEGNKVCWLPKGYFLDCMWFILCLNFFFFSRNKWSVDISEANGSMCVIVLLSGGPCLPCASIWGSVLALCFYLGVRACPVLLSGGPCLPWDTGTSNSHVPFSSRDNRSCRSFFFVLVDLM